LHVQWPEPLTNSSLKQGQPVRLARLQMLDSSDGWGLETTGHIVRTTDGGSTWQDVTPPNGRYDGSNFFVLDSDHAWAVDGVQTTCGPAEMAGCQGAIIWRTTDGGRVWHYDLPLITNGTEFDPVNVQFATERIGWLIYISGHDTGGGIEMGFALSDDGGASWTVGAIPQQGGCLSSNVLFVDARQGWIGNNCPRVTGLEPRQDFLNGKYPPGLYQTRDGGRSWKVHRVPMPTKFPAEMTNPVSNTEGFVFCGISNLELISEKAFTFDWDCLLEDYLPRPLAFRYKYLTVDSGQTWHVWLATGNENFANTGGGWRMLLMGGGQTNQLQQSVDGGLTWTTVKDVVWPEVRLDFLSAKEGWAIVSGEQDAYALVHTTDGGRLWLDLKPKAGRYQAPELAGPTPIPQPLLPAAVITNEVAGQVAELGRRGGVLPCPGYWSADGHLLAVAGSDEVNEYESSILNPVPFIYAKSCGFAFLGDWSKVAIRSDSGEVLIRRMPSGELLQTLKVSGNVDRLAFSRDGDLLAMATDRGELSLWRMSDGTLLFNFGVSINAGANLAFSPDGKLLVYAGGNAVRRRDTASGQELRLLQGSADLLNTVAISPDGTRLAAGPWNGSISLWELPEGTPLSLLPSDRKVTSLAFSPDGRLLASGAQDGTIQLWDSSTGQLLTTLVGHTNWVAGVTFSPDGMRLLSTSADETLRVWGIPSPSP
jgi:photosystem II stability/assembly factor-like uncharacterized protein